MQCDLRSKSRKTSDAEGTTDRSQRTVMIERVVTHLPGGGVIQASSLE